MSASSSPLSTSEPIPAEVFEAAYVIYLDMEGSDSTGYAVRGAVAYAFQAGRESMMPKPKPPIVYVKPRGICSVCFTERSITVNGCIQGHDLPRKLRRGYPYTRTCAGSRKPPKETVDE